MRVRHFFYLFFFIGTTIHADNTAIIPTAKLKIAKNSLSSLTSGPRKMISHQQIKTAGIYSLTDALQNLGALQLHDMTGTGSQVLVSMRGFGANANSNTLFLINGIPITNPDLMPLDLNTIPVNQIKAIEIIAGSESVLYGDQAVGGAINVITEQSSKNLADLSCAAGSYQFYQCDIALHPKIKSTLDTNFFISNQHNDNYREHNQYSQQLLLGNFLYKYARGRLNFNYKIANEDMQYPGPLTAQQVFQDRRQANNSTDFFKDWNGMYQLTLHQKLNDIWHLQTDLARREMHGHGVLYSPFTQSRLTYFIKPQIKGRIKNVKVVSGIDAQEDHYHLKSSYGSTDNSQHKYSAFGVANFPLYQKIILSIGARVAQQENQLTTFTTYNNVNRAFASTIGISWPLTNAIDFYLRRAESFRFPKADESSFAATPLRTQRGVAYETGMQFFQNNYTGKLEIYQLALKDEIAFDPTQTPQQPFGTNRNLDPTIRRGLGLSGLAKINEKLQVDGQYNYVNAKFQKGIYAGNRIPLVAENIIRIGIDYLLAENWNIYTEGVHTGNQYADNDNANIAGKIGGYTIYNFNLNYHYKNIRAALHVNNIFDKYYYFYTVYQAGMNSESFYPAPGRNVMLTVKYLFE